MLTAVLALALLVCVGDPPWHTLDPVEAELVSFDLPGRHSGGLVPVRVRLPSGLVIGTEVDLNLARDLRPGDPITLRVQRSLLLGRHDYHGAIPSRYLPRKEGADPDVRPLSGDL